MVRIDSRLNRWYLLRDLRKYFGSRRGLANTVAHARLLPIVARFVLSGEKGKPCVLEVQPEEAELLTAPPGRGVYPVNA